MQAFVVQSQAINPTLRTLDCAPVSALSILRVHGTQSTKLVSSITKTTQGYKTNTLSQVPTCAT
jgi:hypothetical protein